MFKKSDTLLSKFDVGRGATRLSVLAVLARGEKLNGYRIATVLRQADPAFHVPYGVIYPLLERMERARLIRGEWTAGGQGRSGQRVYSITARGHKALEKSEDNWGRVTRSIKMLLRLARG